MLQIESTIILTASPGDILDNFAYEAVKFYREHRPKSCVLSFNGWLYKINDPNRPYKEIVNEYMKFCAKA